MATVIFVGCLVIGPQVYISKQKSASFDLYSSTSLLSTQIAWGIDLLKYGTVEDEGHWRGLTDFSPSVAAPNEENTIRFYLDNPARAAFLMASDAYAGFHGDQLKPYWQPVGAGPLTRVADSVVVYRIRRSYGDGKDREHWFVTSSDELVRL